VPVLLNRQSPAQALIDNGSEFYGLIDERFAARCKLDRIQIAQRTISGVNADKGVSISEVAYAELDTGGYQQDRVYFYVHPKLGGPDLILGRPWLKSEGVIIDEHAGQIVFKDTGLVVKQEKQLPELDIKPVGAASLLNSCQHKENRVFAVSMADINKALGVKRYTDPREKFPEWLDKKFLKAFDQKEVERLPPLRPGVDHKIELIKDANGKTPEAPWGPLYNMSRDELLALRKKLHELLTNGWIRVSNSPAAAPVLFVKKPGGGLRFCVDYRALNQLTRKDRYPLPLIHETLNRIGRAKWFTKIDVVSAFQHIRIAEGDEWLTAFRTRFGLFEWLVLPFGLANGPSTFQRYINWALREYLDEFVSAYIDDVLIFTEGSRAQHRKQVEIVIQKLMDAGLTLNIDKSEFEVESTKYLGFIIEAGKGMRMDPEKVAAIRDWELPKSVKGVQSFLGFANFYRRFIKNFSDLASPLTALTRKDKRFEWNPEAEKAFNQLKDAFIHEPMLAQFDHERETIVETDSSGYCTGAVLSQFVDGILKPCAYFSKKNTPAECNYPIHDKELLAIVNSLREWRAELRSVKEFKIRSDHKNLEFFMTVQKLTERQIRW
jgi:predicted aspartyl protease